MGWDKSCLINNKRRSGRREKESKWYKGNRPPTRTSRQVTQPVPELNWLTYLNPVPLHFIAEQDVVSLGQLSWLCPLPASWASLPRGQCEDQKALVLSRNSQNAGVFDQKSKTQHCISYYEENELHPSKNQDSCFAHLYHQPYRCLFRYLPEKHGVWEHFRPLPFQQRL